MPEQKQPPLSMKPGKAVDKSGEGRVLWISEVPATASRVQAAWHQLIIFRPDVSIADLAYTLP